MVQILWHSVLRFLLVGVGDRNVWVVPLARACLVLTSLSKLSRWLWTTWTILLVALRSLALALADGLGL